MSAFDWNGAEWTCSASGRRPSGLDLDIVNHFQAHIQSAQFPCPMAQSALFGGGLTVGIYDGLDDADSLIELYKDAERWNARGGRSGYVSFLAAFRRQIASEQDRFHSVLWKVLGTLRLMDTAISPAPPGTSDDINAPDFAFSLYGSAFFVVGLSPVSPRISRRTRFEGFALNPHDQFEKLRAERKMERIQQISRKKDLALQGSTNPLLASHGEISAAHQYSAVEDAILPEWPKRPHGE